MIQSEEVALDALQLDSHNANRGTSRGEDMIEQSIFKFGFVDAGILDKNRRIIGGNKRTKAASEVGHQKAIIVKHDGKTPIYLQYDHLDLDDPDDATARQLAYALNRSHQVSLDWDPSVLAADTEQGLDLSGFFLDEELADILKRRTDSEDLDLGKFEGQTQTDIVYRVVIEGIASQEDAQEIANQHGGAKVEKYRL